MKNLELSVSEVEAKVNPVLEEIKNRRKYLGCNMAEVADKCALKWNLSKSSAHTYIAQEIESAYGWILAQRDVYKNHKNSRTKLINRALDYLEILGFSEEEKSSIFRKLNFIHPDINYSKTATESLNSRERLCEPKENLKECAKKEAQRRIKSKRKN